MVAPFGTELTMTELVAHNKAVAPPPEAALVAALGRRSVVVPGFENKLSLLAARFLPRRWFLDIVEKRQREQTPAERK